jgi:hypothetical protein
MPTLARYHFTLELIRENQLKRKLLVTDLAAFYHALSFIRVKKHSYPKKHPRVVLAETQMPFQS